MLYFKTRMPWPPPQQIRRPPPLLPHLQYPLLEGVVEEMMWCALMPSTLRSAHSQLALPLLHFPRKSVRGAKPRQRPVLLLTTKAQPAPFSHLCQWPPRLPCSKRWQPGQRETCWQRRRRVPPWRHLGSSKRMWSRCWTKTRRLQRLHQPRA